MTEQLTEQLQYVVGYVMAGALTALAFFAVIGGHLARGSALAVVAGLGFVQLLVHLRYFLHIGLSRQKREDLQLILFSALLLAIMVGGTVWVMGNLQTHMS